MRKPQKLMQLDNYQFIFRLTVDGQRFEFSSKKFIEKSKWSPELSKMKGSSEEARTFNNYLDLMKSKVFHIQMELIHKNEELSLENFKSRILGTHRTRANDNSNLSKSQ